MRSKEEVLTVCTRKRNPSITDQSSIQAIKAPTPAQNIITQIGINTKMVARPLIGESTIPIYLADSEEKVFQKYANSVAIKVKHEISPN